MAKKNKSSKRKARDGDLARASVVSPELKLGLADPTDGAPIDDNLNEPTMGEKLASLNLVEDGEAKKQDMVETNPQMKPPSADSIHVLLRQALNADDRALLTECLQRQDEKVISNSVSQLNPSDILMLLQALIPIVQSRGAVLACSIPWLRNVLLQHASRIMSQESSLVALNSLHQLIESRVSTFRHAVQLSSCLDLLYAEPLDDGAEETNTIAPIIYEDKDESDDEGSEDSMEIETQQEGEEPQAYSDISDYEDIDGLSD